MKFRTVKQLIKVLEKMPPDAIVGTLAKWEQSDWTYDQLTHADLQESVELHPDVRTRGKKAINDWVIFE